MPTRMPQLEFLGFEGCPNTPALRERLSFAINRVGLDWDFADVNQALLPYGDIRRGYPAPTILIAGSDLFGLPMPVQLTMSCRLFPDGLPSVEEIAQRLQTAINAKHARP